MDLADIRNKARTRRADVSTEASSVDALSSMTVGTEDIPLARLDEGQFWEQIGVGQFATEEEYAQGLVASVEEDVSEQVQWLGFHLGTEEYALELEVVSELIKPRALTALPQVPDYVFGIISLRGEVIQVIDLNRRLGLTTENVCDAELQRIVVCEGAEQRFGLLVDRVSQVVRMPISEIETPQLVGDSPAAAFIQGVGRKQGKMLILLRPEKIMEIDIALGE